MQQILLAMFLAVAGVGFTPAPAQRVEIDFACAGCASTQPGVFVWDTAADAPVTADVVSRSSGRVVLSLQPGYYSVRLSESARCSAERYVIVLAGHDRNADIPLTCRGLIVRVVDAMHGVAGTIPRDVRAITLRPAAGGSPFSATISNGAYYADEWSYKYSIADVRLFDGRVARIALTGAHKFNISMIRHDISPADIAAGVRVTDSPFEVPGKLVEGPARSVWVLDRPGNRVTAFRHGHVPVKYALPTAYAGASDIAGTANAVWVAEGRIGKVARFLKDGSVTEFSVPVSRGNAFSLGSLRDGRILYWDGDDFGVIDREGHARRIGFGVGSLLQAPDIFNAASGIRIGNNADTFIFTSAGVWHSENYRNKLEFIHRDGLTTDVSLPFRGLEPRVFVADRDGSAWFSDRYGNVIGRATRNGTVHYGYSTFGPARISDMAIDRKGKLWIAEPGTNVIEHFDEGLAIMPPGLHPKYLLVDSIGNLWYSDPAAGVVGLRTVQGRSWCYAFKATSVRSCRVDSEKLLH